ncbi:MAG: RNA 2',3'-cyclic phosphodiesterase [Pirellulales bacterium]|nr:RNA 2',3'-cyclic phosphodiesterase [Pirellulales bacterium]
MQHFIRTFVATEISLDVRARATTLIKKLRPTPARVRWVDPENLHLTLKFLDNVETERIPQVCREISQATRGLPEFEFRSFGVGAFPDAERPRTVWIGVREGSEELIALHDAIEGVLEKLGFRAERRRFRPHLTIGRVRGSEGIDDLAARMAEFAEYDCGSTIAEDAVVFASKLDADGPLYEVLGRCELRSDR